MHAPLECQIPNVHHWLSWSFALGVRARLWWVLWSCALAFLSPKATDKQIKFSLCIQKYKLIYPNLYILGKKEYQSKQKKARNDFLMPFLACQCGCADRGIDGWARRGECSNSWFFDAAWLAHQQPACAVDRWLSSESPSGNRSWFQFGRSMVFIQTVEQRKSRDLKPTLEPLPRIWP